MRFFTGILLLLCALPSQAVTITYDLQALAGSTYRYDYIVQNDGVGSTSDPIQAFTIFFVLGAYENVGGPTGIDITGAFGWDGFTAEPDPALPDDGFADWCASDLFCFAISGTPSINFGESLAGFSVVFDWIGSGTPGSQQFHIYDPEFCTPFDDGCDLLETGVTTPFAAVPEPGTVGLLFIGLLALWFHRRLAGAAIY